MDDLTLAARCASGDPEAVSRLVEDYGPLIARAVRNVLGTGSPDRAVGVEDVVAEIFLRLFEADGAALRAYRGQATLRAYLAGISRRTALDALRKGLLRASLPLPAERAGETRADETVQLLALLPERDRRVLELRYLQGRSYREITGELGIPLGTAATWVARARERLRKIGRT